MLIKGLVEAINRLEGVPKPGSKPAVKVVAKAMAKEAVLAVVTELIFGFALASLGIAARVNERVGGYVASSPTRLGLSAGEKSNPVIAVPFRCAKSLEKKALTLKSCIV